MTGPVFLRPTSGAVLANRFVKWFPHRASTVFLDCSEKERGAGLRKVGFSAPRTSRIPSSCEGVVVGGFGGRLAGLFTETAFAVCSPVKGLSGGL
jgi:hypothetical protein